MNNKNFINEHNNTFIKVINTPFVNNYSEIFISGNNNTFINQFNNKFIKIRRDMLLASSGSLNNLIN